ncbi:Calvin cycle protein CP12-2, chloroplastic [Capsicum annuum]|uniref:Calvin cycle protein CP12-2, chloroplastic n=1 Tax=Capsicum annuum TaxID=4072 RepID=A0A1U8FNA6_CAPAN|nr:calvin cycle protein CP12-2, chloroplastic [Capsicum annuum]KAF3623286.1 Calvin cycle protein CP12-2, chloroplastic [Capsicum annuum]KAF3651879.1 Calvin cycle protein CP12-2, chloroplastic [Capsicum annuum]PHT94582.1 Calvin cycle protein CP12-2, chloroplastic [Capsicum annuum]
MATVAGVSLTTPKFSAKNSNSANFKPSKIPCLNNPWKKLSPKFGLVCAAPDNKLSDLVAESVKGAEEACNENPTSGECAAAWDVVEEASAAASHARDKKKQDDPLENYCKENPETDECRTYDS